MNYNLIRDVLDLLEEFEKDPASGSGKSIQEFKQWNAAQFERQSAQNEPNWEGKESGRSAESVINTLIVHMNRYAKSYAKAAIHGSEFSTQEDFIYLINLKAFGQMTKMDLIKKNVHEKPAGMQIINRLIAQGWVHQSDSEADKRSKILEISEKGCEVLERQMDKIRKATGLVTGDLTRSEKMELIRLLNKLNDFHQPIYDRHLETADLLDVVIRESGK